MSFGSDRSEKINYPQYRLLGGCREGSELYIQGIAPSLPEKWTKISINGSDAHVDGGQYIGIKGEEIMYMCTLLDSPTWNAGYQVWEHNYELVDGFDMTYDVANKQLSSKNPNNALTVNAGDRIYNYGTVYLNAKLTEQPLEISLKPKAPFMNEDDHYFTNGVEPELVFQMLPLNENNQLLDAKKMGFSVYKDNELYVFDGYTYWFDDEEDMTFFPWLFQSPFIYSTDNGAMYIFFQEPFIHGITVRAIYRDSDGTEYLSKPLDPLNPESSINTLVSDSQVVSEIWYDLNGQITDKTAKGIKIKCQIMSDGNRRYSKTTD